MTGEARGEQRAPVWLFILELAYVGALVGAALLYAHIHEVRVIFSNPVGPIPLGVIWWGALGGVTISLTGIFRHAKSWDDSYDMWHIARPALGAVMGSVGYLIFVVVIRAASTSPPIAGQGNTVFYLVAFLLGYREQVFRDSLRKAVDVLISPSKGQNNPPT